MMSAIVPIPRSVMVVEDESLVRMMAVDMFEEAGFRVVEAESGDEAALLLSGIETIDGLFTDIGMPGLTNGIALARIASNMHPGAAIMIVSSQTPPAARDLPAGSRFFAKPYDNEAVLRSFGELLITPA
jgi:CheY-like chemotaxis protein